MADPTGQAFARFSGFYHPKSANAPADDERAQLDWASTVLHRAGIRLIHDGVMHVGVWSWMDSPELRRALAVYGSAGAPIVYLDGPFIADRYREYRGAPELDREPPPLAVVEAMYRAEASPWEVRDRMLAELAWKGCP